MMAASAEHESSQALDEKRPMLDPATLYGPAGDYVRLVEPCTEADPAGLLFGVLAMFGSACGRARYAEADAVQHHANLFIAIVGKTAKARKGTTFAWGRNLFEGVDPDWTGGCIRGGLSSGEGLIFHVRDAVEKNEPVREKNRPTGEMVTVTLDTGVGDKRMLCREAEMASVFRRAQRQTNTVSEILRSAWETGNLSTMTRNEPLRATHAHVSVIGDITLEELRATLDSTEIANGFANRFAWVFVQRSKLLPFPTQPDARDFEEIAKRFRQSLRVARQPRLMKFSSAARDIWRVAYPNLSADRDGITGAILARSEAQVLRFSLIYALLDGSDEIGDEPLLAALAAHRYVEASVEHIWKGISGSPDADAILSALRSSPGGLTRTAISAIFGRNISAGRIDRALQSLVRLGRATLSTEKTNGRPAEVWNLIRSEKHG